MDRQAAGRPEITDTNFSPVVQVITWLLLAANFLAVILRVLTRLYLTRQYRYDDFLIVVAFVCLNNCCSSKSKFSKALRSLLQRKVSHSWYRRVQFGAGLLRILVLDP